MPRSRAVSRHVEKSHLAKEPQSDKAAWVAEPLYGETLDAILISCQYAHLKLDLILDVLDDDHGEEEEDEPAG